jgi:hypothetical protein
MAAWTGTKIGGEGPPPTPPAIGRRNGGTMLTFRGRCGRGSRRGRGGQIERRNRRENDKVEKKEDVPMQVREKLE